MSERITREAFDDLCIDLNDCLEGFNDDLVYEEESGTWENLLRRIKSMSVYLAGIQIYVEQKLAEQA